MKRGEVWTAAGGADYAGKPRPSVIVQDDAFEATESITICALTSWTGGGPLLRPLIMPSDGNGLSAESALMIDKITTLPRTKLRQRIGRLSDKDMRRLGEAMLIFFGLAAPVSTHEKSE
ncbi:type II toxin-antitoxin system PemK/MazF family toxin [Hansschlegelia quercus]|uniref:Type II toxin-antitoxin system PemK/MazF family toxin n=1 Tax=Hansschlegelia quercus TaxID=2528245 RepID=A0A4Q9GGN9_9HYPH|nr:type II toxin-antitoxin system PemK/MazF family toxin [Hansschlegelia quercus]TBN52545.1 type II toxin-antitoxin system PemK/MazF family toxin [Hansschlegelia quercus]